MDRHGAGRRRWLVVSVTVAGLVVARTHPDTAGARLASWLLARSARHSAVRLEPAGVGATHHAVVLLVAQYGTGPSPAVADLVADRRGDWHGRSVALVAYGGVSRGADAAGTVGAELRAGGATVLDAVLGINTAVLRRDGGPGGSGVGHPARRPRHRPGCRA